MATTKGNTALSLLTLALAAAPALAQEAGLAARATQRLSSERANLGLDARHDFRLAKSHKDELGQVHTRYQQTFNGVRVFEGDIIVHQDAEGAFRPHTNDLKKGINLNTTPTLTEAEAFAAAHQALAPKGAYAVKPTAELVIFPTARTTSERFNRHTGETTEHIAASYTLAYLVHTELDSQEDSFKQMVYVVDAHTGAILKSWNNLHTSAAVGTGKSQYSGTVSINTNSTASGFEMRDMTRGTGGTFGNNVVTNANHATTTSTATGSIYTNTTNTWGDGANYVEGSSTTAANGQTAAVDAMFGMMTSWDFYKNVLGRNGIDGTGKATYSRVHIGNSYDNAFWSDSCFCMTYGDGSSFTTLTSIDVAGHEMSHGVIANTVPGGLTYSGESGGLNESNSDIFGTMIEFYDLGGGEAAASTTVPATGGNFTIGEQLSSTPLRYMYKPSLDGSSPDAWSSSVGNLDVHYSSGPGNRQFYFLAQGSSSSTSSNFYSSYLPGGMAGVGNDHAARIHYRAIAAYYTSGTNYAAARTAHINAAKDLYGAGSAEEIAVWNSFAAINVGSAWSGSTSSAPSITSQPASVSVAAGATATFSVTASGTGPLSYQWRKNGSAISGATSASYTTPATATADNGATFSVVVSNSLGSATSNNATLTVTSGGTSSELVANGGFESGATSWTQTSGVIGTYTNQPAHAGSYDAWMCGYGSSHTDYVQQAITIPSTATSATLSFWMHIDTAETTTSTAYDTMKVQVINGTTTTTLATYSNLNKAAGYVQKTFDLSAYKGKTVTLKFLGVEDSSLQTSFVLDDVSVKVQ